MNYSVIHTDALIIGTGLSGLLAARTLTKKLPTAEILMIGNGLGASPYVHGFNMVLHEEDSMDSFKEDTVVGGRNQSKDELVNALCDGSRKLLPVLEELGIEFNRKNGEYSLLRPLGASHPRVASVGNHTGVAIMNAVRREFETNEKVSALEDTRALRLLRMDGRVCGALTYQIKEKKFTVVVANAVVMACGGFCNIYPFSTNMSDIGGDGIAMAFGAGADLCDLEFVQFEPSAAVAPKAIRGKSVITTMYYEGAVLRNTLGERFMLQYGKDAECVNKDVQAKYIFKEIKEGRGTENGGVYFDATGVGRDRLNEQYDSYVKRYSDVGIDIATTPFEIAPAPHTSLGGIAVDEDCFSGIEGLYACGEIIGGLHGANRLGGNAGLETMVFGRIAGDSVADYLADAAACEVTVDDIEDFVCDTLSLSGETPVTAELLDSLRGQMQNVLGDKLNVLRCGTELEEAVNEIGGMLETLDNSSLEGVSDELKFATLRLVNDLQTAYLLAISAYTRTESCGCHVRTDCDEETEDKYRVVIRNAPEGALVLKESI
ncbi:MAG: FAD-binding protein [Clostridia bacterium]|nr:FAD-binding protein [Clostridia bacterium]